MVFTPRVERGLGEKIQVGLLRNKSSFLTPTMMFSIYRWTSQQHGNMDGLQGAGLDSGFFLHFLGGQMVRPLLFPLCCVRCAKRVVERDGDSGQWVVLVGGQRVEFVGNGLSLGQRHGLHAECSPNASAHSFSPPRLFSLLSPSRPLT